MKILLVDDHPVFRSGMVALMRTLFTDAEIVETGDISGLKKHIDANIAPDLILLDLLFPGFDAIKDFVSLRAALPVTPIVAVSMTHDDQLIDHVMQAGANGFVSKTTRPSQMSEAFRSVMDGEIIVRRASVASAPAASDDPLAMLTARQIDVLRFVGQGLSNKEIARKLEISPFTVRTHVSAVLRSLELPSRSAAASFAASKGFA